MDRTSTRRPRRLRALLVVAALGTSLFATALPAAAAAPTEAPPPHAGVGAQDDGFAPSGLTWIRTHQLDSQGLTWIRSMDVSSSGLTWIRATDDELETQGLTWIRSR
jgi:hypothetical protein